MKFFLTVFITVFLAELGDKTQLATMLYSSQSKTQSHVVFFAAASALVLSTLLGVYAGRFLGQNFNTQIITKVAGVGFVLIGIWTILKG